MLLAACTAPPSNRDTQATGDSSWTPPPAGSVVAADSMKIVENYPDSRFFSVKLSVSEGNTGKHTESFKYDMHAKFGQAHADGRIIMPFGGERLKPLLRRGEGYSYIMGFIPGKAYGSDTAFHEYYHIIGGKDFVKIIPLKGFRVTE
jgi:hypothetical protein